MAVESPIINSPSNMMSAFSPYTEFSLSPNSPAMPTTPRFQSLSARSSADASSLHPNSIGRNPTIELTSPSDMVGPSPVTSNGTNSTDFEDDAVEDEEQAQGNERRSPDVPNSLKMLSTNLPPHFMKPAEDEPSSVIHAPQGYMNFNNTTNDNPPQLPPNIERSTPKPFQQKPNGNLSIDSAARGGDVTIVPSPVSPPPISTDHPPSTYSSDDITPRAQTRQELDAMSDRSRLRSSSASSSLEGIPEDIRESEEGGYDYDTSDSFPPPPPPPPDSAVDRLKTALHECWTLCNTLASLSSAHRERIYSVSGSGSAHEKAWKCCWKLCIELYTLDEESDYHCRPILDLCREFCQALFEVRQRQDEIADSVLRVSFELNNHLYYSHNHNLPEAFHERTLDFYITLCHRLMKQRNNPQADTAETDSLLQACWSLAEMLFSLRQNRLDGKDAEEELLASAVQACWDLSDLFREGWTQVVRPERGTPRPSQTTFSQSFDMQSRASAAAESTLTRQKSSSSMSSMSSLPSLVKRVEPRRPIEPDTPVTEFEDTPISPEDNSPSIPNILVLGTENSRKSATRWSSSSSNLSGYSQGSNKTSSTVKTATSAEDANLTRLKILILKAAMNAGYSRPLSSGGSSSSTSATSPPIPKDSFQSFVKSLPPHAFGRDPWQEKLLVQYKELVGSDSTFKNSANLPSPGKRAGAAEVAKSVRWMGGAGGQGQWVWLGELFKLVFGFDVEGAEGKGSAGAGIVV